MSRIYICYRRRGSTGEARLLCRDLVAQLGEDSVFMDVQSIPLGVDFRRALQDRLARCDLMLVLIGNNWADVDEHGRNPLEDPGDYVRFEIEAALKRDIPITPVLTQGVHMPTAEQLPAEIKDFAYRNAFELSNNRWDSDVGELIRRLGIRPPTTTSLDDIPQSLDGEAPGGGGHTATGDLQWRAQRKLALIAIMLGAVEMAQMGGLFALALRYAVPDVYAMNRDDAVFDVRWQAWQWMLTGLLAYGTATFVGIQHRAALARRGLWRNVFDEDIPPLEQWAKLAALCLMLVVLLYAIYFFGEQILAPHEELLVFLDSFPGALLREVREIIPFGIIAALHGVMVAVLMDLRRPDLEGHTWKRLVAIHVAILALAGCAIGYYISSVRNVPVEAMYVRLVLNSLAPAGMALIAGLVLVSGRRRSIAVARSLGQ